VPQDGAWVCPLASPTQAGPIGYKLHQVNRYRIDIDGFIEHQVQLKLTEEAAGAKYFENGAL